MRVQGTRKKGVPLTRNVRLKEMKLNRLPISLCHANCPRCRLPTELKMFESGPGGELETYIGNESGTIYRLDLGKINYLKQSRSDLLAEALEKEGQLTCMPNEIQCKICGTIFNAKYISVDGEEIIDAYEL
jgi:hypothetical protein